MSWLHNNLILPLMEPERHRGLGRRLRALGKFERLSEDEQRKVQAEKISQILHHAYQTVPLYKESFGAAGSHPYDWQQGQPIPLPLTSRETIRAQHDQMVSRHFKPSELHSAMTGGTTSTPVKLERDIEGMRNKIALQYHLNRQAGYDQGDSVMVVWGALRDLEENPSWKWRSYEEKLKRQIPAPAGQISPQILENFRQRMNHHKPRVLFGYSMTMVRLAEHVKNTNLPHHRPKSVIVTAEAVSKPEKQLMEEIFGCAVTEQYGSREVGMVASECDQHNGLHFHPAACFTELEFHANTPDGPMYRLIITDLLNYGMPLIRYDTGDCVLLNGATCACGRWYPRVKSMLGRALDTFVMADGTEIPGLAVANQVVNLTHNFKTLTQMQVIQKTFDFIQVRYVANGDPAQTHLDLQGLREAFQKVFRVQMHYEMVRVDDIPRAASGKLRLCISEVERPKSPVLQKSS